MSQTNGGRRRISRLVVLLLSVVLSTGTLTAITMTAAEASTRAGGFKIHYSSYADGSWMGARKLGNGQTIYRINPKRRNRDSTFYPAAATGNLYGSAAPSPRATNVAAWIASFYGAQGGDARDYIAAGTDAAMYHLLQGGDWQIGHSRGAARIRQTGVGYWVKQYARAYIYDGRAHAGPYKQTLRVSTADAGSATKVTYRIVSTVSGKAPTPDGFYLPVTFYYPGQPAKTSYTNSSGVATATFTARAGSTKVTAVVAKVPETRLHVRKPKSAPRASRVVVAGKRVKMSATAYGAGITGQSVSVNNAKSTIIAGQALAGTYSISGGHGSRTVYRRVYGPFSDPGVASCTGTPLHKTNTTISRGGTWDLPKFLAPKKGYYRWYVLSGSNKFSYAASECAPAVFADQAEQSVVVVNSQNNITAGQAMAGTYSVTGGIGTRNVTRRAYGPFADAGSAVCSGTPKHTSTVSIDRNGTWSLPSFKPAAAGYWRWQVTAASNTYSAGASDCGSVVYVAKAEQGVSITNAASTVRVGAQLGGRYTITGGAGTRDVTRRVHGPFTTGGASVCSNGPLWSSKISTSSTGTWSLPAWSAPKSGYYRWYVLAGANAGSHQGARCGAPVRVQRQTTISQQRPAGFASAAVKVGQSFNINAVVNGFDRSESHTITSRLYGPFSSQEYALTCNPQKRIKWVSKTITGNGTHSMPAVSVDSGSNAGWYAWKSTLSGSDLLLGSTSTCSIVWKVG